MRTSETIEVTVKQELCTGCGTCVSICPKDAIHMVMDDSRGIYVPQLDKEGCNECGICFDVCPGHAVDFRQLNLAFFGREAEDFLLGNYLKCHIGHAADYDIRYNCASGGLVTALLIFALEQGIIDGALVTRMSEENPLQPQPFIAKSRKEIISASKSKYCPVPANVALREILQEEGKFAVVGLPCHIHGIRKAELVNKKLKDRIVLHLGIFCGNPMTFQGTDFLLEKYGVAKENVAQLDYRGRGWPGYMTIQLKEGAEKVVPLSEYIIFHDLGFFGPSRCALCCDQMNQLADISLGDAWLPELMADRSGTSIVICRSEIGRNLLEQAAAEGEIRLQDIDEKRIRLMPSKNVQFLLTSRLARLTGRTRPRYNRQMPRVSLTAYPLFLLLHAPLLSLLSYPNRLLSRHRHLWWLIGPVATLEGAIVRLGSKLARLLRLK